MVISPYDNAIQPGDIEVPLTEVPSHHVPQTGVHLYHLSMSYYSQIARLALEEAGVAWESHPVLIVAYEQYSPAYVQINPRCVVPTLAIDGRITTDAYNICRLVNEHFGRNALTPDTADERACMERFSRLAKGIFVEALSYGDVPQYQRPLFLRLFSRKNHRAKQPILRKLIEEHKDDPFLKNAYEKKLKILELTENTLDSTQDMQILMQTIERSMDDIEIQLAEGPFRSGGWLCSQKYSQADLEWSVMLRRFYFLTLDRKLLPSRPHTASYQERLFSRSAFRRGVAAWEHPLRQILIPLVRKKLTHQLGKF